MAWDAAAIPNASPPGNYTTKTENNRITIKTIFIFAVT